MRNLFGTSFRSTTKDFDAIDMHLCTLIHATSTIEAIVKRIDVVAIGSFNTQFRNKKCMWAILHSRSSNIEERRCDCYTVLPAECNSFVNYHCGTVKHIRGVDTGFPSRGVNGRILSRMNANKTASCADWRAPTVVTGKLGKEQARWFFQGMF